MKYVYSYEEKIILIRQLRDSLEFLIHMNTKFPNNQKYNDEMLDCMNQAKNLKISLNETYGKTNS